MERGESAAVGALPASPRDSFQHGGGRDVEM